MYDWHLVLGIASGLFSMGAVVPYIKDILHGTTRPNIVSWSLWVLLLSISIGAQISSGASWSIIFVVGDLIGTSSIVVLCLLGYGYGKYGWVEGVCLALAILAIILWQVTDVPLLAILCALVADMLASIPTIVKTYKDPMSEASLGWFVICFGGILAVLSTTIFDPANLIFPIYLILVNGLIGALSLLGRQYRK